MTFRKSLLSTALIAVASTSLLMGGCNGKDKGEHALISAEAAPLGLKSLDEKVFARHFDVAPRTVSDEEANLALKALSMDKESDLTWQSKAGEKGNYVYNNLQFESDEETITIGQAELLGVHMQDGEATFDRVNFEDITVSEDEVSFGIKAISLARPSPKMAQLIMHAIQRADGLDDLDIEIDEGEEMSLGAVSINQVSIKSDEATGTIEQIVWGTDEAFQKGDAKFGNMDFTITDKNDVTTTFSFEGGTARGLNMEPYKKLSKDLKAAGLGQSLGLGSMFGGMNVFAKPYDDFTIGQGTLKNEFFSFDFKGFEGQAKEKNGVTTITQVSKPMTLKLLSQPKSSNGARAFETFKSLGFDSMTFKTSQTQIMDKAKDQIRLENGLFEMEDGFRLNYAYEGEGLAAMVKAAEREEANLNEDTSPAMQMQSTLKSLEALKLQSLKVSLEDKSIVERALKLASEMFGQSPDMLKKQMKMAVMAAPIMAEGKLEKSILSELGSAVVEFVENDGETLTISVNPPKPLSITSLIEAKESNLAPEELGFSASVSEK
ncbi:hypothetical protein DES40_1457 [Litorimonas taeanensis]|uniref:Lipoprotein n=2 Tax=Litorimonas taeanensis TaxID=568099 RepID=A0A420WMA2_9PROT|nr:hypothetical protein DES40_1457 [Litorimonas taeanensis]